MLAIRDSDAFGRKSAAGAILSRIWPLRNEQMQLLLGFNLTARSRMLDVGCGSGAILKRLAAIGFQDLTGVDPLLKSTTQSGPVKLLKADIEEIGGRFDFIMFNHSLEHLLNPEETGCSSIPRATSSSFRATGCPDLQRGSAFVST
jgi:2-polyprenyl-3-methyl-5-hydroxy-6-metoxy-1,4-benzoquinol methylase